VPAQLGWSNTGQAATARGTQALVLMPWFARGSWLPSLVPCEPCCRAKTLPSPWVSECRVKLDFCRPTHSPVPALAKINVHPTLAGRPLRRQAVLGDLLANSSLQRVLAIFAMHFEDKAVLSCVNAALACTAEQFASAMSQDLTSGRVCLLSESELASVPAAYLLPYFCYCTLPWLASDIEGSDRMTSLQTWRSMLAVACLTTLAPLSKKPLKRCWATHGSFAAFTACNSLPTRKHCLCLCIT